MLSLLFALTLASPANAESDPTQLSLSVVVPETQASLATPLSALVQLPVGQPGCQILRGAMNLDEYAHNEGSLSYRVVQVDGRGLAVHQAGEMKRIGSLDADLAALQTELQRWDTEQRETVKRCGGDGGMNRDAVLVFLDPALPAEVLWRVADAFEGTQMRPVLAASPSEVPIQAKTLLQTGPPATLRIEAETQELREKSSEPPYCLNLEAAAGVSAGRVMDMMAEYQPQLHPTFLGTRPQASTAPLPTSPRQTLTWTLEEAVPTVSLRVPGDAEWEGAPCGQAPGSPETRGLIGNKGMPRTPEVPLAINIKDLDGTLENRTIQDALRSRDQSATACGQRHSGGVTLGEFGGNYGLTMRVETDADGNWLSATPIDHEQAVREDPLRERMVRIVPDDQVQVDPALDQCLLDWAQSTPLPQSAGSSTFELQLSVLLPPDKTSSPVQGQRGEPEISVGGTLDRRVDGALTQEEVDAVLQAHMGQIRYCYLRVLVKQNTLSGSLTVDFVVQPDGSVTKVDVQPGTLTDPAVLTCMEGRFLRMQYPEPTDGEPVLVHVPLVFTSS